LRKRLSLTQTAAVEKIEHRTGVALPVQTLSRWERSLAMPALGELAAFLTGLGYTHWDLCNLLEGIDEDTLLDKLRRAETAVPPEPAHVAGGLLPPTAVGPVAKEVFRTLEARIAAIERAIASLSRPADDDPDRS
jgi:hypothetical protein